jgi:Sec-independent protein translocase protein TatA
MFEIGWSELLIAGVIALVAVGLVEHRAVLGFVGRCRARVRRRADDVRDQLRDVMRPPRS